MYVALTRAMGRLYLPCVVDAAGRRRSRCAAPTNRSTGAWSTLVRAGRPAARGRGRRPRRAALVTDAAEARARRSAPPPALLARPRRRRAVRDAARARTRAPSSRRTRGCAASASGARPPWAEHAEDRRAEKSAAAVDDGPDDDAAARRARRASSCTSCSSACRSRRSRAGDLARGARAPEVPCSSTRRSPRTASIRAQRDHAEQLVWAAYTTPGRRSRAARRLPGFAAAAPVVREMEFVYPIPEPAHPALGDAASRDRCASRTGYVRGSLDLAFEHDGLTYFADWKSDALAVVRARRRSRATSPRTTTSRRKLYALAVVKLLGRPLARRPRGALRGLLYCFFAWLRRASGGLWSARPSWDEHLAWDESLRARRDWGSR